MTDVSAHLIYLQQCNNFSQLPFLMPRPGLPDGKMAAHSKEEGNVRKEDNEQHAKFSHQFLKHSLPFTLKH